MTQELFKEFNTSELVQVVGKKLEAISFDALCLPTIINARQKALRVWQAYNPKDPHGKPIEPSLTGTDYNRFVEIEITPAEAAMLGVSGKRISVHDLWALVNAETGMPSPLLEAGNRFLHALKNEPPGPHVLLTEKEYGTLTSGAFDKLDGQQFLPTEQRHRDYVNQCVRHSFQQETDFPFKVFVDTEKMDNIETIMRADITSCWLLDIVKKNNTPVIFHEYTVSDSALVGGNSDRGTFIVGTQFRSSPGAAPLDIEYIRLFVNKTNNFDLASVYSHEARHFWQKQIISPQGQFGASPIDKITLGMLREADARAIQAKVNWSLRSKLGHMSMDSLVAARFERNFSDPAYGGFSHATRLKKAMQAEFLAFLEKEFSSPVYLKDFIGEYMSAVSTQLVNSGIYNRLLSNSQFLTTEFLRHLSQMESASPYLNKEGTRRVAGLFNEKLPWALARYKSPASAYGAGPSV